MTPNPMKPDSSHDAPNAWKEAPRARALRLLQNWIKTGSLKPGSTLPSERQLAAKLDVSLATTQRAVAMLEEEGLILRKDKRSRIVAGAGGEPSVLANTVLVFTDAEPSASAAGAKPSGFIKDIGYGALKAVGESVSHAMVIHPAKLNPADFARLLQHRPKGVVVSDLEDRNQPLFPELAAAMKEANIPFVVFGDYGTLDPYDRVVPDHEAGEYEVTRWLISRGRRRILCIFPSNRPELAEARYAGYRRAMEEAGLAPLPILWDEMGGLITESTPANFRIRTAYFHGCLAPRLTGADPVDALVTTNDRQAFEVGSACRDLDCLSDDRLLIAGYDNFYGQADAWERDLCPIIPAATVDKQNFQIGVELVRLLLDRIEGRLPAEHQVRKVPPVFIPLR